MEVMPARQTHWPVSYAAAMMQFRDGRGRLHSHSIDIPSWHLDEFSRVFMQRLSEHTDFVDAYFIHELKGSKGASAHRARSEQERQECLDDVLSFIDHDAITLEDWWVDVGLEINLPGHVTHWVTGAFEHILQQVLPNASATQLTKLTQSKNFHVDLSASLADVAGFRTTPASRGQKDHVTYIQAYCTEKSGIYQLFEGGLFRRHSAHELLPGSLPKLIEEVEKMSKVMMSCAGEDGHIGLEGNARLEVRIPLKRALSTHYYLPSRFVKMCTKAIPLNVWW